MVKELNDNELENVTGGALSCDELIPCIGKEVFFEVTNGFDGYDVAIGWVTIVGVEDPYVYIGYKDETTYNKLKDAQDHDCALEECVYKGQAKCFKVDNGFWHATYFRDHDPRL